MVELLIQTSAKKEGNLTKRNVIIIFILFAIILSIFGGLGYELGFYIANPKLGAGIYMLLDFFLKVSELTNIIKNVLGYLKI